MFLFVYWSLPHAESGDRLWLCARFDVIMTTRIQVAVFCLVTPWSCLVGQQHFERQCCHHYEDGDSKFLRNVGIIST
jgi:hypothetical protein